MDRHFTSGCAIARRAARALRYAAVVFALAGATRRAADCRDAADAIERIICRPELEAPAPAADAANSAA